MSLRIVVCVLIYVSLSMVVSAEVTHWIRFDDDGTLRYGIIEGEQVRIIDGLPWGDYRKSNRTVPRDEVKPTIPSSPTNVLGAAYNYRSHLGEKTAPTVPQFFWKTAQSLVADGEPIVLPPGAGNAHYEAELVIVIGKSVRDATLEQAAQAIFGYTCGNDVSERDWQKSDVQWWRAKASRTFGPVGPVIVSGVDWKQLRVQGLHNGKLSQDESASDMIFSPVELVQYASQFVTLQPGDLIFTAAPGATEALSPGDTFEVRIEPIGTLRNSVRGNDQ